MTGRKNTGRSAAGPHASGESSPKGPAGVKRQRATAATIQFTAADIVLRPIDDLKPFPNNPKRHPPEQVAAIAENILRFGFDQPILIDENDTILKGHGRQLGARKAKLALVPTIKREGLSPADKWAIVISDNQLPVLGGGWDQSLLRVGLTFLAKNDYPLQLTGFNQVHLATFVGGTNEPASNPDEQPEIEERPISKIGETWLLGDHVLHCANSEKFKLSEDVRLQLTDPPYELEPEGGGLQSKRSYPKKMVDAGVHRFDVGTIRTVAKTNVFFTSKKLVPEYLQAAIALDLPWDLNVMHRSAAMPNTAGHLMTDLDYIIVMGAMNPARGLDLVNYSKMLSLGHWDRPVPWAKPVEILTKYIRLFSAVGDLVFDPYCGSGSTIIACAMEGRRCIGVELNPVFVDLTVRRWQEFTGGKAVLKGTKQTFDQVVRTRSKAAA